MLKPTGGTHNRVLLKPLSNYLQTTGRVLDNKKVKGEGTSYNMVFVSAPVNIDCPSEGYHWYIELDPRLVVTSGLEIGTGYYVNPIASESNRHVKGELFKGYWICNTFV